MIHALLTMLLAYEQQPLPYCPRCGGHYPPHGH